MTVPREASDRQALAGLRATVFRLAGVMRMIRIHSLDNRALGDATADLAQRLSGALAGTGELLVRLEGRALRVNGTTLATLGDGSLRELTALARDMEERALGGLHIRRAPSADDLGPFLQVWRAARPKAGADTLNAALRAAGLGAIEFLPPRASADPRASDAEPEAGIDAGLRAYCALLTVADLLADPATAGLPATERHAEAALHAAADVVASAPEMLLCTATHRDNRRYAVVHGANTAALAMLLARAVGLPLESILDVGRGALFCDVGMGTAVAAVRARAGELDPASLAHVLSHPLESFAAALGPGALEAAGRARLVVAFEHHCGVDGEGYPAPSPGGRPHIYTRICAVADGYDALVHDRGDRNGLPRPLALEVLWEEADRRLDRRILGAFLAMTGRFPPGSVVQLQEGWTAMTATPSPDPRMFDRPDVLVFRNKQGKPIRPRLLRLSELMGERATRISAVLDDRLFPERLIPIMLES